MGIIHPVAHAARKWPQFKIKILLKSLYNRGSKTSLHFINNSFTRPSSAQLLPALSFLIADSISDIVIFLSKFSKTYGQRYVQILEHYRLLQISSFWNNRKNCLWKYHRWHFYVSFSRNVYEKPLDYVCACNSSCHLLGAYMNVSI